MTPGSWATGASVLVFVVALAGVAWDRRRLQRRLSHAEGSLVGLSLDLDATRSKVLELQSFLSEYDSWAADSGKPVPSRLSDRRDPNRWTPHPPPPATPRPAATTGGEMPATQSAANPPGQRAE